METPSRREELEAIGIGKTTHTGLWLDKYLKKQVEGGGENAKTAHFQDAARCSVQASYRTFFARWTKSLDAAGALSQVAKTEGRLAIGLGGESVLETAITLHHTYGVPYIPGSALKGLAARYARNRLEETWDKNSAAYKILFGTTEEAGYVTFFDALYIPVNIEQDHPLALDVITVHHPEYYQGKDSPPADWDNPTPISFLSATGSYLIALHGAENWVEAAFEILRLALAKEGIGAKTSSGYGRMVFTGWAEAEKEARAAQERAQKTIERFRLRLDQMSTRSVAGRIHNEYERWKKLEFSAASKRIIAQLILERIESAGRTKKSRKKKWFQELVAFSEKED
ncbi:MAG: type III-B CRISPR module RAMP protein Cmr6 [Chloroflexota bacterium]|nr:type III-B CRISPR module RAMP protein Cmr6 [Chloroflexota bacterium]